MLVRKIDGKAWSSRWSLPKKSEAQTLAKSYRRQGKKARVIKDGKVYRVYTRV